MTNNSENERREEIAQALYEASPMRENMPARDDNWRVLSWDEVKANWPDRAARAYREADAILAFPPLPQQGEAEPVVTIDMQNAGWRAVAAQGLDIEAIEVGPVFLAMLAAAPPASQALAEPVAWETRHMYGNNEWSPWEKTTQVGAERWRCDPSFKNGRREVRDLYEAPKSGAVAGHEPAAWGLIDPETGEWKSNKLFHRQADAEQSAVNLRNGGLELEARPLYAAPPASQALAEELEEAERTLSAVEKALTLADEPEDYNPTLLQRAEDIVRAYRGNLAIPAEAQARVEALEAALLELNTVLSATPMPDCATMNRLIAASSRARALLSGSTPKPAGVEITEEMVEAALKGRVPGGAEVWNWLPLRDEHTPHPVAKAVIRAALTAALSGEG